MKKPLLAALIICLCGSAKADGYGNTSGFSTNQGFLNGTKLYTGIGVGAGIQGDICNDPFFNGSCDNKDVAWKVFGGARFDPMWGAEAAYNKIGSSSATGDSNGNPAGLDNSLSGISLAGVGYLPVADKLEAFGKGGVMFWQRETTLATNGASSSSKDDGASPLVGGGAQYQLNENIHLRGEWEHVFNVGGNSAYETDADMYSIGLLYSTL